MTQWIQNIIPHYPSRGSREPYVKWPVKRERAGGYRGSNCTFYTAYWTTELCIFGGRIGFVAELIRAGQKSIGGTARALLFGTQEEAEAQARKWVEEGRKHD